MTTEKEIREAIYLMNTKGQVWHDGPDKTYRIQIFQVFLMPKSIIKCKADYFYGKLQTTNSAYNKLCAGDPNQVRAYVAAIKDIVSDMIEHIKETYNQDLSNITIHDPRKHTQCLNESSQTGSKD